MLVARHQIGGSIFFSFYFKIGSKIYDVADSVTLGSRLRHLVVASFYFTLAFNVVKHVLARVVMSKIQCYSPDDNWIESSARENERQSSAAFSEENRTDRTDQVGTSVVKTWNLVKFPLTDSPFLHQIHSEQFLKTRDYRTLKQSGGRIYENKLSRIKGNLQNFSWKRPTSITRSRLRTISQDIERHQDSQDIETVWWDRFMKNKLSRIKTWNLVKFLRQRCLVITRRD
ncbi:hypothetical protein AVEN_246779-1 [Araneus ventricosus]|uniref:Uncharacterized protein n=1 Tax=Araneus ventricosus TaxID=182803 RepID=A0A4Y2JU13_ARAVE|nr:hypothetical protein AVEN_246779-1 [Araneus ventricosus]